MRTTRTTPADTPKNPEARSLVYTYRGQIERGTGKPGYRLVDGFSATTPEGSVFYPWMTRRECQADASAQGKVARFEWPEAPETTPGCDGMGPHEGAETRRMDLSGGAGLILCRACYGRERAYQISRGWEPAPLWDVAIPAEEVSRG